MLAAEMDPNTDSSNKKLDLNKVEIVKEFRSVEGMMCEGNQSET